MPDTTSPVAEIPLEKKILSVLQRQTFADWYGDRGRGRFDAFICGGYKAQKEFGTEDLDKTEELILQDIRRIFKIND